MRDGPRRFGQDSTCPALLRCLFQSDLLAHTGLSPSMVAVSTAFRFAVFSLLEVLQPRHVRKRTGLGSAPFARHYSGYRLFFLFLRVLRCFSSPGSPHLNDGTGSSIQWVAPFGHARIITCLQFPEPFRSLPRPSSPPDSLGIRRSLFVPFSVALPLRPRGPNGNYACCESHTLICALALKLQSLIFTTFEKTVYSYRLSIAFSCFTSCSILSVLSMN